MVAILDYEVIITLGIITFQIQKQQGKPLALSLYDLTAKTLLN